jgi:hypothetical protein
MPSKPSPSPPRGARIAAFVFLAGLGLLVVLAQGSSSSTPTSAATTENPVVADSAEPDTSPPLGTPPAADLAALLNGLALGNEFDGWKVVNFSSTNDKIVWIEFGQDKAFFSVGIVSKGKGNPPPPIQTENYEVGYGLVRPKGASIPQDVFMKMAEQIASRIRMREREVPKPAAF